ncbi:MAG: DUF2339 domain-containing protein [Armatimonadetes bacterium]|nr:DUF2339 domain-containing protein [Armatimonadota bacterium]
MTNEQLEWRIQTLETGFQGILHRLTALEDAAKPGPAPARNIPITPPPVMTPEPPRPAPKTAFELPTHILPEPKVDTPYQNPRPYSAPTDPDELEYKFGINGLLRGGAAVILCAVLFLVALALGRGWITPTMQFAGEILLCLGFIAIGVWKHDEREDFGHLMVGLGSFGLYASFAGAYAYKHLFEGETLVCLYMLLSLANLGYSHWRASKTFLTIGLIGGLVAAIMPMHRDKVLLDFALHFAILLPCSAIILRNKWQHMATFMWVVSTLALLPAATSNFHQAYRVGAIYLNCAIALFVGGRLFKPSKFDPLAAVQSVIVVLTGCLAVGIDEGHKGSVHALVLTAIAAGVGYLVSVSKEARNATWLGALIVAMLVTPLGSTQEVATSWYAVEALVLAAVALRANSIPIAGVGIATFLASGLAYVCSPAHQDFRFAFLTRPWELSLLAVYVATIVTNLIFVLKRSTKDVGEITLFFGGALIVGIFVRAANVALGYGATHLNPVDISAIALAFASLGSLGFAVKTRHQGIFGIAALFGFISCIQAILFDPLMKPTWVSPMLIGVTTITVVLSAAYVVRTDNEVSGNGAIFLAGLILSAFFVRVLALAGASHLLSLDDHTYISFGIAIINLVWTLISLFSRRAGYLVLGWLSTIAAALNGPSNLTLHGPQWLDIFALAVPIAGTAAVYWITPRPNDEEVALSAITIIAEWVLVTFLMVYILTLPSIGMGAIAATTVSWVTVAMAAIVSGFMLKRRHLRYWSLVVFAATVGKVFLVDLSTLDSFIRVLMLMLLGFGMVGGGYWYILWRRGQENREKAA